MTLGAHHDLSRDPRISQGRDEQEAMENIKEAVTAWLRAPDQRAVEEMPAGTSQMVVAL
jgi:predicted RNase H-like HicB family nuclease